MAVCVTSGPAVATVRAHQNKYETDFNTVVTFLTNIKKRGLTLRVKIASVAQI